MQRTATEDVSALAIEARNDPAAFGRLYNQFVQPVYRYLRSRVQDVQVAEDLTSQTFMAAFENIHRYHERGYFSAWLFRIARSKLMDHFRRHKQEISLDEIENHGALDDALGRAARGDEIRRLAGLIRRLDPAGRDLITLRYVADLSFAEMAEVLGKSEGAVKKSLYRLLASIKSQMENNHE